MAQAIRSNSLRSWLIIPTALAAAAVGGWLTSLLAPYLYFPLIPGLVVGWSLARLKPGRSLPIYIMTGFFGFVGIVFADALTFDLVDYPGTWNYITHFYVAATPMKCIFWGLNVATAIWFLREPIGSNDSISAAMRCEQCGNLNPHNTRFCGQCGQSLH